MLFGVSCGHGEGHENRGGIASSTRIRMRDADADLNCNRHSDRSIDPHVDSFSHHDAFADGHNGGADLE